jgi:GST-like protein
MSNYTLYGSQGSGAAAVEAAFALAGITYRYVEAASWEPGPGLDDLMQVNPLAQIPTLVLPDGTVMTESAAILVHLGLAHPRSDLLPQDESGRAHAIRGLVYVAANCYAAIGVIDFLWEVFADAFPAQPFLSGDKPGALDVLATVVSKWSGSRQHLATARPQLCALFAKVEQDPRLAPIFARHWPR